MLLLLAAILAPQSAAALALKAGLDMYLGGDAYVNNLKALLERGDFDIMVEASSVDIRQSGVLSL